MIRNNIVLSVYVNGEDVVLDYDDNTAIGLNYNAYQIENVGDMFLDYTRTFSLPKTPTNNRAFSFICSENSASKIPYGANTMKVSVDGVLVMDGNMFITSVEDRYNVQLVVNNWIFNELKSIPFVAMHTSTSTPISLASIFVNYWNNTIREEIRTQYAPRHNAEWLDAVINYCTEKGTGQDAKNKVIIPRCVNQFGYKNAKYNEEGTLEESNNNIFSTSNGKGFCIAQSFPDSYWTQNTSTGEVTITINRYNNTLLSPFWLRIDLVLQLIEQKIGFSFGNLYNKIKSVIGRELYVHIPSVELDYTLEYDQDQNMRYISYIGKLKIIKGGEGVNGCKYSGTISDLSNDDFPTYNCCDLIKTLINDYALIYDIDKKNATFKFEKLSDIMSASVYDLKLSTKTSKSFSLDSYKQLQSIKYKSNATEDSSFGAYKLTCNNKNIDKGSYDDSLFDIERHIFKNVDYFHKEGRNNVKNSLPDINDNSNEKEFLFCVAKASGTTDDVRYYVGCCEKNNTNDGHSEYYLYASNTHISAITEVKQPTVSASLVYSMLQNIIDTPIRYNVEVLNSNELIFNFKHFAICRIEGLPGYYYIQSINDYNPRTDNTLSLTIVKLPPVAVDLFKLIVTENDIDFVTEEDANVITEESNH